MNHLNRRRFVAFSSAGLASAVLVACGNESTTEADLNPTQIPDVADAPPTLAPITATPGGEAPAGEEPAAAGGGGNAEIESGDVYYEPTELELAPGGTLTMNNAGVLQHDLVVEDWGDEEVIPLINGGESAEYTIPEDAEVGSTVTFYCSVPGHREAGMEGTITIVEPGSGGAAAGGEEGATPEGATPEATGAIPEGEEAAAATGGGSGPVAVSASEMLFEPAEFTVAPGSTITVTNDGVLEHDFAVDDWGGVLVGPLAGGESGEYAVPDDAEPGATFEFYCSIPGHKESGMVGTLTIGEAGGGTAAGSEEEASPEAEEATPEGEEAAAAAATGGEGATEVSVSAFEFGYDPADIEVVPGARIIMTNDGFVEHDIAVDAWGGEIVPLTGSGEQVEGTIPADAQAGETFEFYCTVVGHRESGMVGTFIVVAGAASGDATAVADEAASPEAEGTGNTIEVASNEWQYVPNEFEVAPGDTIVLRNDGAMAHDMSSEEWGEPFIPDVAQGETGSFVVPEDAEVGSTIEIYSNNQGAKNLGMIGTIRIVEETEGSLTAPPAPPATPGATPEASPVTAAASGGGNVVEVEAGEFYFEPNEFEVSPGDTIRMTNAGFVEHDMASEALGITMIEIISAGETSEFVVPDDASGEIDIYCTVAGHKESGMTGTIMIV